MNPQESTTTPLAPEKLAGTVVTKLVEVSAGSATGATLKFAKPTHHSPVTLPLRLMMSAANGTENETVVPPRPVTIPMSEKPPRPVSVPVVPVSVNVSHCEPHGETVPK